MNYSDTIAYIHSLERFGIKPGLERISALCEKIGNPQNHLRFIHVAGTNGKGSACTMIAEVLKCAGYKTGLYTSPYVTDFRERIQINSEMIAKRDLISCVGAVKTACEKYDIQATEFEFITAAALLYFYRSKCDAVVLEVGLGGRFDATNIIPSPSVAVIMHIAKDHTAVLGNTVAEIAFEKCGIIKPGCKVVSYPLQEKEALEVIENTCKSNSCSLIIPHTDKLNITGASLKGTGVKYGDLSYSLRLPGEHIVYNSIAAVEAVRAFDCSIRDDAIEKGLSDTVMPARMEIISENPAVILDGGHNEDCAVSLEKFVKSYLGDKNITVVSSIMQDKDYNSYLKHIASLARRFIAVRADVPRALDCETLAKAASAYCDNCIFDYDTEKAVLSAAVSAGENDAVIICGSFYLAGEIRSALLKKFKGDRK